MWLPFVSIVLIEIFGDFTVCAVPSLSIRRRMELLKARRSEKFRSSFLFGIHLISYLPQCAAAAAWLVNSDRGILTSALGVGAVLQGGRSMSSDRVPYMSDLGVTTALEWVEQRMSSFN